MSPTQQRFASKHNPHPQRSPLGPLAGTVKDDSTDEAVETLSGMPTDGKTASERVNPGYLASTTRLYQNAVRSGDVSIDEIYRIGGQLFDLPFTRKEGLGTKDLKTFERVHDGDTA